MSRDSALHRALAVVIVVAGIAAPIARLGSAAPARSARGEYAAPRALPPGPGRDRVAGSCLMCHSAMLITQQHKDSTAWEKTLGQMEKWGAPVAPAVRDSLRGYLVSHFGPRTRPGR